MLRNQVDALSKGGRGQNKTQLKINRKLDESNFTVLKKEIL